MKRQYLSYEALRRHYGRAVDDLTPRQQLDCILDYDSDFKIIKLNQEGILFEVSDSHPDIIETTEGIRLINQK